MIRVSLILEGLETPERFLGLTDEKIERAAYRAINFAADRSRTLSAAAINKQINFPASYLTPAQGRLAVAKKAGSNSIEAVITARHRATSLARFATSNKVGPTKEGVTISMKKGRSNTLMRAFLIKLKSGKDDIDTAHNLGLAVRTKRGERPAAAYKPVRISDSLYLLYGASVDQVFKTVRSDVADETVRVLEQEYIRQLEREMKD